ncbi:protein CIP2A homolog [Ixodes scapularis]|uniref:protein CIP2A homolog n=1 Tax=Ixodes scapularis TaxID=6945 RepID=UPI001A9D96B8|nr:protein CIP2A homolog [Ixodes scapularis]
MEVSSVVKGFLASCNVPGPYDEATNAQIQRQLDVLIGVTTSREFKFFNSRNKLARECLSCAVSLLLGAQLTFQTSAKVLSFLHNIEKDPALLDWLRDDFQLHSAVAVFLQSSLVEENPSLLAQAVHLLKALCYRRKVTFTESSLCHLLTFLLKHIEPSTDELLIPCLELLNFISWSEQVQQYAQTMPMLLDLFKALIPKYNSDNTSMVIHALSIYANFSFDRLVEDKRFQIFSHDIKQTLTVILSAALSQVYEVSNAAVDLLEDLLKSPQRKHNVLRCHRLLMSCASKIVEKQSHMDSLGLKTTLRLLTALASEATLLEQLSSRLPNGYGALSPILRMAIDHEGNSLQRAHFAVTLFSLLLKDMCGKNMLVAQNEMIVAVVKRIAGTLAAFQEKPLAEVHCAPEMHLVSLDLFTTLLGSEIYGESIVKQCITADHVTALLKPYLLQNPQEATAAQAGQWVQVVTAALGLLVDLMDKITGVRESLNGLFEESNVARYLSLAMVSTEEQTVLVAFKLACFGHSIPNFKSDEFLKSLVSENQSRCRSQSPAGFVQAPGLCQPVLNGQVPNGWRNSGAGRRRSVERSIDEITRKLEQSFEMGDLKHSEILAVYENKIAALKAKEDELLHLLTTKNAALQQSDRLVSQYTCSQARREAEMEQMRSLLRDSERRLEEARERMDSVSKDKQATSAQLKETRGQVKSLESHIRKLEATNDALEVKAKRLKVVLKSLEVLQQDNKSQSEMLTMLQRHSDSMKQKNDSLSKQIDDIEAEKEEMQKLIKEHKAKLKDQAKCMHMLQTKLDEKSALAKSLASEKNSLQDANSLLQRDKSNLEHELQALESQCQKNESALQAKTALVEKLRSQLDKHRQMQEMIRSISAPTYDTSDE